MGKFRRSISEDKKEERTEKMINKNKIMQKLIISLTILSFYGLIDLYTVHATDKDTIVDPLDPTQKAEPIFPPTQSKKRRDEPDQSEDSLINLPDGERPIKISRPSKNKERDLEKNSYLFSHQSNTELVFPDGMDSDEGKEEDLYLSEVYIQLSGTLLFGR
ncbi:conserved hypothetical protein [Carnobacterium divergens]|nr:conserved hypothetical protein [Carnobacterium divergens]